MALLGLIWQERLRGLRGPWKSIWDIDGLECIFLKGLTYYGGPCRWMR
jgi:hypothetical protein